MTAPGRSAAEAIRTVVVDDAAEMRHLLRALLRLDGRFDVVGEAADGEAAIEVVAALSPDVVVLDLAMPRLDGMATIPRLRERSPATRIVVLSGHPAEDMAHLALTIGAVGYVEKSADMGDFPAQLHTLTAVLDTVEHVLDRTYDPGAASATAARRDVRAALERRVGSPPDVLDVVELLCSELVTNAAEHARSRARLTVLVTGRRIRVSVHDDGPGMPVRGEAAPDAESGRGLQLLEALSAAWGVDPAADGKTVWFEVEP